MLTISHVISCRHCVFSFSAGVWISVRYFNIIMFSAFFTSSSFAFGYLVVRLPYCFLLAGFYFETFFRCLITSILLTVSVEDYCCTWSNSVTYSVVLLWKRDRPVAETSTWQYATFTRDRQLCPSWDSNPKFQQANDLGPRGHRDRLILILQFFFVNQQSEY